VALVPITEAKKGARGIQGLLLSDGRRKQGAEICRAGSFAGRAGLPGQKDVHWGDNSKRAAPVTRTAIVEPK
jgi:hypothetical protein